MIRAVLQRWKQRTDVEYAHEISMLRKFTNVIAGTGAAFAFLHVFFGYMGFDKTPNGTTGEVPRFLDEEEYLLYLVLCGLFALTILVAAVFRRFPSLALIPATITTTYLMLLFDENLLTAGPMTFLVFSLFVFAGHLYVSLSVKGAFGRSFLRYVIAAIGAVSAVWALVLYLRVPSAPDRFAAALKPNESLDGVWAVWKYNRLQLLTEISEEGSVGGYLWIAVGVAVSVALLLLLPRQKWLLRIAAALLCGYLFFLVTWEELPYYPMLFAVPMLSFAVVVFAVCAAPEHVTTVAQKEAPASEEGKESEE